MSDITMTIRKGRTKQTVIYKNKIKTKALTTRTQQQVGKPYRQNTI